MFVFQSAAPSSPTARAPACASFIDVEPYRGLLMKWGLRRPGESEEWHMHTYRYSCASEAPCYMEETSSPPPTASPFPSRPTNTSVATVSAFALRFHHGVAADFLRSFFASPCVRSELMTDDDYRAQHSADDGKLQFRPLTCHWTTLEQLRHSLVDAKVVRQVMRDVHGAPPQSSSQPAYLLPTVKRAEELLPHGEVISDELRALFLRAHSHPCVPGSGEGSDRCGDSDQDGTDDDGDDDMWNSMGGSKLSLRQLRAVFGKESRDEFLYHIVWRLIAGSGPLNQFEDDAAVYLDAARELYRNLVQSLHVSEAMEPDVNDDRASLELPDGSSARYKAVVDTSVYEVFNVPGMTLFPRSDGVYPSNLNYCYVAVNPSEQTATVWYHRC
ncbi:hypothetical protein LSCM1_01406 [Leishmania martiniquensis]|uniref:Cilia- and flagella-associated protein 300 n=1 Tax=Leishmania martiniquensis TaxID=1580590 RepID=A0A836FXV4_9TRYP|nr:hypothetical protein LSCM1_01406 [Leishmania martiniquensis]